MMSRYKLETEKVIEMNGIDYTAKIEKVVEINFSDANYMAEINMDGEIELIPNDFGFLEQVTNIFPLSEYNIRIFQNTYKNIDYVSIRLEIEHKESGDIVYLPDSAILSDKDYNYLRDILEEDIQCYHYISAEEYLRNKITQYLGEINLEDIFSDAAYKYLCEMASDRWDDIKSKNLVTFDDDTFFPVVSEILETALKKAMNNNK